MCYGLPVDWQAVKVAAQNLVSLSKMLIITSCISGRGNIFDSLHVCVCLCVCVCVCPPTCALQFLNQNDQPFAGPVIHLLSYK